MLAKNIGGEHFRTGLRARPDRNVFGSIGRAIGCDRGPLGLAFKSYGAEMIFEARRCATHFEQARAAKVALLGARPSAAGRMPHACKKNRGRTF